MGDQNFVARCLSETLSVIAHPHRIRIIEELGIGECDVGTLVEKLMLPQPTVSQHLAQLRHQGIVQGARSGKTIRYSLTHQWLAGWLVDGIKLLEDKQYDEVRIKRAVKSVRKVWRSSEQRSS
jgi:DNA-binding transcriptional ArsR family regulator